MQCPSCGTDVRPGQKFCMECGESLRGVSDVTGEVPTIRPDVRSASETSELPRSPEAASATSDETREMVAVPAPPNRSWSRAGSSTTDTSPPGVLPSAPPPPPPPPAVTGEYAAPEQPAWYTVEEQRRRPAFRLRPLLVLAVIAAMAAVVG